MLGDEVAKARCAVGVEVVPYEDEWGAELVVDGAEQVAVVGPGKAAAPCFRMAIMGIVEDVPVDQTGPFALFVAAQATETRPRERPLTRITGVRPRLDQVRQVGGVIEKPASSSKTIQPSSAAAVLPPGATCPSPSR